MYIYIYIYMCVCIYIYIYIHTHTRSSSNSITRLLYTRGPRDIPDKKFGNQCSKPLTTNKYCFSSNKIFSWEIGKGGMRKGGIGKSSVFVFVCCVFLFTCPIPPFLIPPFPFSRPYLVYRAGAAGRIRDPAGSASAAEG